MPSFSTRRRLLLGAALAVPVVILAAGPASAHVTVSSPDARPGGFGKVVFRVPTESDKASTVGLTVTLPTDTPFAFVSSQTRQGWTVTTTDRQLPKPITAEGFTIDKATATVKWTATTGGIAPHQFDEFALSVGPFPEKVDGLLTFTAVQTYSDGSVVRWDQPVVAGKAEPEHPAPQLTVPNASPGAATAAAASSGATPAPAVQAGTADTLAATTGSGDDAVARWAAVLAVVIAAVAVGLAVLNRRRPIPPS
jgi:periplasmic copper chaperone A